MEGGPIIKVADLSNLWLETQVNVSYAKNLKSGSVSKVSFTDYPNTQIQSKSLLLILINPDSRLLLIRMEVQTLICH
jgi:Cu(I)/Ag(I) efflux system membrane fusion protein